MTPPESAAAAEWRGRITQTTREHTRRLNGHDRELDDLRDDVNEQAKLMAAHRAKVAVISGLGAVLGSGLGGSLILLIAGKVH